MRTRDDFKLYLGSFARSCALRSGLLDLLHVRLIAEFVSSSFSFFFSFSFLFSSISLLNIASRSVFDMGSVSRRTEWSDVDPESVVCFESTMPSEMGLMAQRVCLSSVDTTSDHTLSNLIPPCRYCDVQDEWSM